MVFSTVSTTRRYPPLNALRMFEVVARTGNFTVAAAELHVTQSAVSRQINLLESYLGVQLFRRDRQGVTLTKLGASYSEQILPALAQVASATEAITARSTSQTLRIRAYTSFIAKWLIPRIPDFRRLHPQVEVQIVTGLRDVDFDQDDVDVAIQFGHGDWPQVHAEKLFVDCIEPVCSPAFLARCGSVEGLLAQGPLLMSHYRRTDWSNWLAATHRPPAETVARMTFSSSVLTWQAAVDGLGIAIGQAAMLKHELDSGQLVCPFRQPVTGADAYWLVWPQVQRDVRKLRLFRDWMQQMAGNCT